MYNPSVLFQHVNTSNWLLMNNNDIRQNKNVIMYNEHTVYYSKCDGNVMKMSSNEWNDVSLTRPFVENCVKLKIATIWRHETCSKLFKILKQS